MALDTIGSIAIHVVKQFSNIPDGVSGTMVQTVDMSRINVQNFTGDSIGSNSISEKYQHAITNFAMADTIDLINTQAGGDKIKLAELSVESNTEQMSADQFRKLANNSLKYLGFGAQIGKTLV